MVLLYTWHGGDSCRGNNYRCPACGDVIAVRDKAGSPTSLHVNSYSQTQKHHMRLCERYIRYIRYIRYPIPINFLGPWVLQESHMDQWTDAARLMDAIWRSDSA